MRTASGVACQPRILKWDLDRDSGISMVHIWMKDLPSRITVRLLNGKRNKGSGRSSRANLRERRRKGSEASRLLSESTPTRFEQQSGCFPTLIIVLTDFGVPQNQRQNCQIPHGGPRRLYPGSSFTREIKVVREEFCLDLGIHEKPHRANCLTKPV